MGSTVKNWCTHPDARRWAVLLRVPKEKAILRRQVGAGVTPRAPPIAFYDSHECVGAFQAPPLAGNRPRPRHRPCPSSWSCTSPPRSPAPPSPAHPPSCPALYTPKSFASAPQSCAPTPKSCAPIPLAIPPALRLHRRGLRAEARSSDDSTTLRSPQGTSSPAKGGQTKASPAVILSGWTCTPLAVTGRPPNHRPRGTLAITIAASTAWAPGYHQRCSGPAQPAAAAARAGGPGGPGGQTLNGPDDANLTRWDPGIDLRSMCGDVEGAREERSRFRK